MSIFLKVAPWEAGATRAKIQEKIEPVHIEDVEIDQVDNVAYIRLRDDGFLEALAGQYGEDLEVPDWKAKMVPLEDNFDWEANREAVRRKLQDLKDLKHKAEEASHELQEKVQSLAAKATEKVEDVVVTIESKVEEASRATEMKFEEAKETVKETAAELKEKAEAGASKTKELLTEVRSKIVEGAAQGASRLAASVQSGKQQVAAATSSLLNRIEKDAQPIEVLPPRRRAYLIEFVLLVWLFSWMI